MTEIGKILEEQQRQYEDRQERLDAFRREVGAAILALLGPCELQKFLDLEAKKVDR